MIHQGPSPLKPGQWIQGSGEDDRITLARRLQDEANAEVIDPNPARFERLLVGNVARDVLAGAAANPQLVGKLLAQLVADCEMNIRDAMEKLLTLTDPSGEEARDLHFKARVARSLVNVLRQYVSLAEEAHDQLNHQADYEE